MYSCIEENCPALPLELAQAILVAAIRSIRYVRRSDAAKQAPYLTVALRALVPEVAMAAVARQVWVDMDHASACGNVDLLTLMVRMTQLPEYAKSLVLHYTFTAMDVASERGHIHVLHWWAAQQDRLPAKYSDDAVLAASESGRVDILEWWIMSGLPMRYTSAVLYRAARQGHAHVLDWWLKRGGFDTQAHGPPNGFLDGIGQTGRRDVLDWFVVNKDQVARNWTQEPCTTHMASAALTSGNVHVLDWMLEHSHKHLVSQIQDLDICSVIADNVRNSLDWLAQHKVPIPNNNGIQWALYHKRDKALAQWLLDAGISQVSLELFPPAFERTEACDMQWWYDRLDTAVQGKVAEADMVVRMFLRASEMGSVDILNWIATQLGCPPASLNGKSCAPILISGFNCTEMKDCFLCASQHGHVAVLDWLVESGISLDPRTFQKCVYVAIETTSWQVIEWLSSGVARGSLDESALGGVLSNMLVPCTLRGFDEQRGSDHVRVLEWIWMRYPSAFEPGLVTSCTMSRSATLLDWWHRVVEQSPLHQGKASSPISLDRISNARVLKWWLSSGRSDFEFTFVAIDQASASGKVDLLDCWKDFASHHAAAHENGQSDASDHPLLKYSTAAMDNASRNGHLDMLEWWESSGIVPLKYSKRALKFLPTVTDKRRAEIVRWWLSSGLP